MPKLKATDSGGYLFDCPGCKMPHVVYVTTPDRPSWTFNGDLDRPTFSPSVSVQWDQNVFGPQGPTRHICHSFVKEGKIQFLDDCTHSLAGQTVELPEWD